VVKQNHVKQFGRKKSSVINMILIIGGTGFVGSHITEELVNKGHSVTITGRDSSRIKNVKHFVEKIKIESVDISDQNQISKLIEKTNPEVIYHLAGQLTTYESFEKPMYDVDVNTKSTIAILEAMRNLSKCRLILGSTFWVIGRPYSLPINEETPCNPLSNYAANRLTSEHFCRIYNKVYDLDTVIMRLTNTFGPREQFDNKKKAAINFLIRKGIEEKEISIYDHGEFFRDIMYISDVSTAAYAIQTKGESGNTYCLGTGVKTWFYDLGKWIAEYTNAKIVNMESPDFHKRINVGNIVVDNSKLKKLGWNWKVNVKDGIKKTVESYLDEKHRSKSK